MNEILAQHQKWIESNGAEGTRADLRDANLTYVNLTYANLRYVDLRGADLRYVDLRGADLRYVNLTYANLSGADLRYVDLRGADLRDVNLRGCIGNMRKIKSMQFDIWMITWTDSVMAIGCQQHSIEDWKLFDDTTIDRMDPKALVWWHKWKDVIFTVIEKSR